MVGLQVIGPLLLLTASAIQPATQSPPVRISPTIIPAGVGSIGSCPSSTLLQSARSNMSSVIQRLFRDAPCGGLGWESVASLDMGDPAQQCPTPWMETNTPNRSCNAHYNDNCIGVTFPLNSRAPYSRVCGRATGYSVNDPDAFANSFGSNSGTIDEAYLDGISVTHGLPRQHIWSFATGHGLSPSHGRRCPCDNSNARLPPSFVGDNYFCDGEYNGALWDAMDCTSACCTFNSPPWFTVTLPTSTIDDIEVRICSDESIQDEGTHLRLLELYVQ